MSLAHFHYLSTSWNLWTLRDKQQQQLLYIWIRISIACLSELRVAMMKKVKMSLASLIMGRFSFRRDK